MSGFSRTGRLSGFLVMVSIVGCGGSGGDGMPRYPASGTVTLEGAPIDGAVVAFSREDGKATAVAMTDEMGQFQLNMPPGKNGVPAGKYRISVRKSSSAPVYKEPTTFEEMEREHKAGKKPEPPPPPKLGVPARYGDPATSQLTEEVKPTDKNEFTIQLKG